MAVVDNEGVFVLANQQKEELRRFEEELAEASMIGEWQIQRKLEPDPGGVPHIWKWAAVYDRMVRACDALGLEMGARRSLLFTNPAKLPNGGTIYAIRAGLQMLVPGEVAWAHRHSMSAIRFIIEGGQNAYTVVQGEQLFMDDWDLILTPAGMWHHHENHTDQRVIWLDAIDTPFVRSVNAGFYEQAPEAQQPVLATQASVLHRLAWARPAWEEPYQGGLPIIYKWADTRKTLYGLADGEGSPHDGILLKYVHPLTGGPVMPTFSCNIQMLRPGEQTKPHRHTYGAVYHVLQGTGRTQAGDSTLEWEKGDSFVIPNWCWHSHRNVDLSGEALLFVVDDSPIVQATQLLREEAAS
jgi:gentisate 1,2-dioxygenase